MSDRIRIPGIPKGMEATRICAGSMVGTDEFELRDGTAFKGGHSRISAVVVVPADGWEFVPSEIHEDGHFVPRRKEQQ